MNQSLSCTSTGLNSGLYHFNARWYDASTGRFISEDPARDGANWFVYVSNNPLKYIDPTGMWKRNSSEKKYSRKHPIASLVAANNARKASSAARYTTQNTEGDSSPGASDAARHAHWSAMNARDLGADAARTIGENHENVPTPAEAEQMKKQMMDQGISEEDINIATQPYGEKEMDLHNNEVGIRIGEENPDATDEELWDKVMNELDKGSLDTDPDDSKEPDDKDEPDNKDDDEEDDKGDE